MMNVTWMIFGAALAQGEKTAWQKPESALTEAAAKGKPVCWFILVTDAGATGKTAKAEAAIATPLNVKKSEEFIMVRGDQKIAVKYKVQEVPMLLFTDADGDEIFRSAVRYEPSVWLAMDLALRNYVNKPVEWGSEIKPDPDSKKLLVVVSDIEDADRLKIFEDRSLVKYHDRCGFVNKAKGAKTPSVSFCDPADPERVCFLKGPLPKTAPELRKMLVAALKKRDQPKK